MQTSFCRGRILFIAFATYFAAGCGLTIMEQQQPESTGEAVNVPSDMRLAEVQLRVGRTAFDQGNLVTALTLFEKAHQSAPNDVLPLVGKGDVLFAQRRFGDAEAAYRAAVALNPHSFEAQEGLGKALVSTQKHKEGLHALELALAIRRDAGLLNKIGVTHEMLGDGETAQEYFRESLALQADSLTARNNLALSLGVSGSYDAALKEMEKVIQSPEASERHHANMAFIYGLSGRSIDQVPPRIANAAASKGWDDAFFVETREVAKSGDRTALLNLLNNRRPATPPSQSAPMTVLPETPNSGLDTLETREKPAAAPLIASRPDPGVGITSMPDAAMAAVSPTPNVTAGTDTSESKLGSPVVLIPPPMPVGPDSAPPAAEMEAIRAEPPLEQASAQADEPAAEQIPEQPAAQPEIVQGDMRTPANSGFDDPDSLGLEIPPSTGESATPDGAFRIQLGAFKTTSGLSALIARLSAVAVNMLPANRLNVVFRNGLYLTRSYGLATREEAQQLCADLHARHIECFVTRMGESSSGAAFEFVRTAEAGAIDRFIGELPRIKAAPKIPGAKFAADAGIGDQQGTTAKKFTR